MGHNGCDGSQASGPWAIGSGYRFSSANAVGPCLSHASCKVLALIFTANSSGKYDSFILGSKGEIPFWCSSNSWRPVTLERAQIFKLLSM